MIVVNVNKNITSKLKNLIELSRNVEEELGGVITASVQSTTQSTTIKFKEIIVVENTKYKKEYVYKPNEQQLQHILKNKGNLDISLVHTHLEDIPPSIFDINTYYTFSLRYNTISPHLVITPTHLYFYSLYPFHVAINNTVYSSSITSEYNSTGLAEFEDELLHPYIVKIPLSII